ncbi:hypothetical protein Tco_0417769 [Tanacetum coccineum]
MVMVAWTWWWLGGGDGDGGDIVYTVDIFCDTIQLLVETPDNPFVAPVNIEIIESFIHTVGYQGFVDKWDFMNCVSQKKDVIEYPRFTKPIIVDLMKKFPSIPSRLEEDYHSVKDDIPLEIHATDDYKEYETVFVNIDVLMNLLQQVVKGEKDEESYADKFAASMIHDDDNKEEKKDDEMGSLENRTEKMQTPIPTTPKSPRINLSSDKNIAQEMMDTV